MRRRIGYLILVFLTVTIFLALQRPLFMFAGVANIPDVEWLEWLRASWHGLVLDISVASVVCLVPWIAVVISVWTHSSEWLKWVMRAYFLVVTCFMAAVFSADMMLYQIDGHRITLENAADLLNLQNYGRLTVGRHIFIFVVCWALTFFAMWVETMRIGRFGKVSYKFNSIVTMIVIGVLMWFGACAGSTRLPYAAHSYFSNNRFLNHASINPALSIAESWLYPVQYPPKPAGVAIVADSLATDRVKALPSPSRKIFRTATPNIVIVVMNGISNAEFNQTVGGALLMPQLSALSREGYLFTEFYSNTPSRGSDAVVSIVSAYPSLSGMSVAAMSSKNETLPSLVHSLDSLDYSSEVMFGGGLSHGNLRPYLYSAGFDRVVDRSRLGWYKPSIQGVLDDAVIFSLAAERMSRQKQPFVDLILTNSTLSPHRIPYSRYDDKRQNAIAFSDEQLGVFVRTLKYNSLWDNMVMVVVGQGTKRGESHVPMLVVGGAVVGSGVVDTAASQSDITPTVLGQLEQSHDDFVFGRDILDEAAEPRSLVLFSNGFGVVTDRLESFRLDTDPSSLDSVSRGVYAWGADRFVRLYDDLRQR